MKWFCVGRSEREGDGDGGCPIALEGISERENVPACHEEDPGAGEGLPGAGANQTNERNPRNGRVCEEVRIFGIPVIG